MQKSPKNGRKWGIESVLAYVFVSWRMKNYGKNTIYMSRQELCLSPKTREYRRDSKLDFRAETKFTTNLQLI